MIGVEGVSDVKTSRERWARSVNSRHGHEFMYVERFVRLKCGEICCSIDSYT